jgi:hypothetical protein
MSQWSDLWIRRWRIGPIQIGYQLHRHRYAAGDHRWVIRPELIVDMGRLC